MDVVDYAQAVIENAEELKGFAFMYRQARGENAQAINGLIAMLHKAGLARDKAAFENKIVKLLDFPEYEKEAQKLINQFHNSHAEYKGLDAIMEAYKSQISGIQSVIKYNLTGEVAEATKQKYRSNDHG
ncbi:MAG: hypothetical protein IKW45_03685 [Clostridia bacterium]|nr:hypothetical protein [Clostridia bacterium]